MTGEADEVEVIVSNRGGESSGVSHTDAVTRALAPTPPDRWPSCAEMMRHLTACHPPAQRAG